MEYHHNEPLILINFHILTFPFQMELRAKLKKKKNIWNKKQKDIEGNVIGNEMKKNKQTKRTKTLEPKDRFRNWAIS